MENKFALAVIIASTAHSGQYRSADKEPYLIHPLRVSELVNTWISDAKMRETARICAVLHDVLEDSACTKARLEKEFGKEIANVVEALSLDKSKPRNKRNIEYIKKLKSSSDLVKMIKLADIYDNSFDSWGDKDFTRYIEESSEILEGLTPEDAILKRVFLEKSEEIKKKHRQLLKNSP